MNGYPLLVSGIYIPSLKRRALAYVDAVVVAAFTMITFLIIAPWVDGKIAEPFQSDHLLVTLFLGLLYGIVTAIAALLPCILAEHFAGLFRVRGAWYFVMWAMVTAVVLGPAVLALLGPGPWDEEYWSGVVPTAHYFAPQGDLCGLVYWWVSRRGWAPRVRLVRR